jgi:hypothetical protein
MMKIDKNGKLPNECEIKHYKYLRCKGTRTNNGEYRNIPDNVKAMHWCPLLGGNDGLIVESIQKNLKL